MQPLKLPDFDYQVEDNQIFCIARKKWVILTPEEWVRQHFLHLLFTHLGYPKGLTRLEHSLSYFKNQKRSDITIMDKHGGVYLLVECKAPTVKLTKRVTMQVAEYNRVLDARYLAITNGMRHFVWKKTNEGMIQMTTFPRYIS